MWPFKKKKIEIDKTPVRMSEDEIKYIKKLGYNEFNVYRFYDLCNELMDLDAYLGNLENRTQEQQEELNLVLELGDKCQDVYCYHLVWDYDYINGELAKLDKQ